MQSPAAGKSAYCDPSILVSELIRPEAMFHPMRWLISEAGGATTGRRFIAANWDPELGTAISDLEVVQKDVNGHLWYFRYPLEDDPDRFITVATTRPETMLGDMASKVSG